MFNSIFRNSKLVEKAMDAAWLRNEAIAQNIANVDTPGYKRKDVKFEDNLKKAINSRGKITSDIDIKVTQDTSSLSTRLDGNNVDIEREMALMAMNTIKYNTLTQRISGEFRKLKSVINEGRR